MYLCTPLTVQAILADIRFHLGLLFSLSAKASDHSWCRELSLKHSRHWLQHLSLTPVLFNYAVIDVHRRYSYHGIDRKSLHEICGLGLHCGGLLMGCRILGTGEK
jgi:hypothetical protein